MKSMKWGSLGFSTIGGFSQWAGHRRGHGAGRQCCLPARPASPWGPWPVASDSPAGRHAAMPPCRHAAMPPHLPMPPAPPSSTPHPRYIRLFIKYSGGLVRVGKILPLPALKPARVPRKKNGTGKKQNLEVIDPPRETHEIDEMGLAGFPYDKDFPNGPVSAADMGPGGSHASQPVRLAPGPWPLISDSPVGHHAAMPPCRHAPTPAHAPRTPKLYTASSPYSAFHQIFGWAELREKNVLLEVIDPPRKIHEIDEMGLAGFLYDKGFPMGWGPPRTRGREAVMPPRSSG